MEPTNTNLTPNGEGAKTSRRRAMRIGMFILLLMSVPMILGFMTMDRIDDIDYDQAQFVEARTQDYSDKERQYLDDKYSVIEKAISMGYTDAENQGLLISNRISIDVEKEYQKNGVRLMADLDGIANGTSAEMFDILSRAVANQYVLDIVNDNNDPFIAIRGKIVTDLSFNCSAIGRTRTFDKEASMHFNKTAAENALKSISDQISNKNVWCFLEVPANADFYYDLKSTPYLDEKYLKDLFYKYDGNVDIYKYPEFIHTSYLYRKNDLAYRPLVDSQGVRQTDSQILMINSGFNIYDIIQNTRLKDEMKYLDEQIRNAKIDKEEQIRVQSIFYDKLRTEALMQFLVTCSLVLFIITAMAEHNNRKLRNVSDDQ